jgi:hypothetical protein
VEEDIPGMLEMGRKFNYHIIIYVKNINDADNNKIQNLQSTGWIDEVIQYNDKNDILTYIKKEDVCQQRSWFIDVPEHDILLSTEAFNNILLINKVPRQFYQNSR